MIELTSKVTYSYLARQLRLTAHSLDLPYMDYDSNIQSDNESYTVGPLDCSLALPGRPDFTGSVLEIGIKLTTLIRQDSHADIYAAEQIDILQKWYEVKAFSTCVESPKQNEYQKRTIKRNLARKS